MTEAPVQHRKPPETHRVKVSISMSPAVLAKIDEIAEENDFPRSLVVQMALKAYFRRMD